MCCTGRPAPGWHRLPCELPSTEQPNAGAVTPALTPLQELSPCSRSKRGRSAGVRALLAAAGAAGGRAACMAPALYLAPGARICSSPWVVCEGSNWRHATALLAKGRIASRGVVQVPRFQAMRCSRVPVGTLPSQSLLQFVTRKLPNGEDWVGTADVLKRGSRHKRGRLSCLKRA